MANIQKIGVAKIKGIDTLTVNRSAEVELTPEQKRAKSRFDKIFVQLQVAERAVSDEIKLLKAEIEQDERAIRLKKLLGKQKKLRSASSQTLDKIDTIQEMALMDAGLLRGTTKVETYLKMLGFEGDDE
jgi:hypothetical protein